MLNERNQQMVSSYRREQRRPMQYLSGFAGTQIEEPEPKAEPVQPIRPPSFLDRTGLKKLPGQIYKSGAFIADMAAGGIIGLGQDAYNNASYLKDLYQTGESERTPISAKQVLLHGAEAILDVASFGTGGLIVKGGAKILMKTGAKTLAEKLGKSIVLKSAVIGGTYGTSYGTIGALEKEKHTFADVTKGAILGGGGGIVGGAILGKIFNVLSRKALGKKIAQEIIQEEAPVSQKMLTEGFNYGNVVESFVPISGTKKITNILDFSAGDTILNSEIGRFTVIKKTDKSVYVNGKWIKEKVIELKHFDGSTIEVSPEDIISIGFKKVKITGQKVAGDIMGGKKIISENIIQQISDEGKKISAEDLARGEKIIVTQGVEKKGALGSFDVQTGEVALKKLTPEYNKTLIHEVAHGKFEALIPEKQNAIFSTINELKNNPEKYGNFNFTGKPREDAAIFAEEYYFNKRKDKAFSQALSNTPGGRDLVRFAKESVDSAANETVKITAGGVAKKQTKLFKMETVATDIEPGKYIPKKLSEIKMIRDTTNEAFVKTLEQDPDYLASLEEIGGGVVIPEWKTWEEALQLPSMTIQELSNWKPSKGVKTTDIPRALITLGNHYQELQKVSAKGDMSSMLNINKELSKMYAGFSTMKGTPGRTLKFMQNNIDEALEMHAKTVKKIQEASDAGRSPEEISKILKDTAEELKRQKKGKEWWQVAGKIWQTIETYSVAAKLTSPVTLLGVNPLDNILGYGAKVAEDFAKAGVFLTKGKPKEARVVIENLFGTKMGLMNGLRKMLEAYTTKDYMQGIAMKEGVSGKLFPEKIAGESFKLRYLANPFRALTALDNFAKSVFFEKERMTQAGLKAVRLGYTGDALKEMIIKFSKDDGILKDAAKVAKEYSLQENPDKMLSLLIQLRSVVPAGRIIVPFLATIWNSTKFVLRRSPLGILSPRQVQKFLSGGDARIEALTQVGLGSLLALGAYQIVDNGQVNGAYPKDKNERARWKAENRKSFTIKIGNAVIPFNRLSRLGFYFIAATELHELVNSKEADKIKGVPSSLVQLITAAKEFDMMSGLSDSFDLFNDPTQTSYEKLRNLVVQGFVPNLFRDIRQVADPVMRREESAKDSLANVIPFASKSLKAKYDILGRQRQYNENIFLRAVKVITKETPTPETEFMAKIGYAPTDESIILERQEKGLRKIAEIPDNLRDEYLREMGEAVKKAVQKEMKQVKRYDRLLPEEAKNELSGAISAEKKRVRDKWKRKKEIVWKSS